MFSDVRLTAQLFLDSTLRARWLPESSKVALTPHLHPYAAAFLAIWLGSYRQGWRRARLRAWQKAEFVHLQDTRRH
jgi:hypothetical protein